MAIQTFRKFFVEFKDVFKLFDKDGDGNVTEKELGVVMSGLGQHLADEELHEMFVTADFNGKDEFPFFANSKKQFFMFLQFHLF